MRTIEATSLEVSGVELAFGSNKVLSMEQIQDLVALLMSRDSPVNK